MRVGVVREVEDHQRRVALTPAGVHELVRAGDVVRAPVAGAHGLGRVPLQQVLA